MTFREAVDVCLKRKYFFKFAGRAPRSEFWWFAVFMWCVNFVTGLLAMIFPPTLGASLVVLVSLLLFPASLGVSVRRLHDRELSGWWLLLPASFLLFGAGLGIIGGILAFGVCLVFIIIYCMPGTPGPNRFGANPLMKQ